jgi:hypothetical protein
VDVEPVDVNFLPASPVLAQPLAFQPSSPAAFQSFFLVVLPLAQPPLSAYCHLQNEHSPLQPPHH